MVRYRYTHLPEIRQLGKFQYSLGYSVVEVPRERSQ